MRAVSVSIAFANSGSFGTCARSIASTDDRYGPTNLIPPVSCIVVLFACSVVKGEPKLLASAALVGPRLLSNKFENERGFGSIERRSMCEPLALPPTSPGRPACPKLPLDALPSTSRIVLIHDPMIAFDRLRVIVLSAIDHKWNRWAWERVTKPTISSQGQPSKMHARHARCDGE